MVGHAVLRLWQRQHPEDTLITADRAQLDLTQQEAVNNFFKSAAISHVVLAAARVGGIHANANYPASFIYDNLMIASHVIHAAYKYNVQCLLNLGSSCIYPKHTDQPINETALLTGPLEPTNEPYAIAKIAAIKLCESYNRQYGTDFRSLMPTNLYGPGDNFHPQNSHVIPALVKRFHDAKITNQPCVSVWGSGKPMREFLYVDDLAKACLFAINSAKETWEAALADRQSHINVGTGEDISIQTLSHKIAHITGFKGDIVFDTSKPDGTLRKRLDVSRFEALGWRAETTLQEGLVKSYTWFMEFEHALRQ